MTGDPSCRGAGEGGPPRLTGGTDDDLIHLVLPDHNQSNLLRSGIGGRHRVTAMSWLGQDIRGHHQRVNSPTEPEGVLVVQVVCEQST